jgi:hypothetical protein
MTAREQILAALTELGEDDLAVLALLAAGLVAGRGASDLHDEEVFFWMITEAYRLIEADELESAIAVLDVISLAWDLYEQRDDAGL